MQPHGLNSWWKFNSQSLSEPEAHFREAGSGRNSFGFCIDRAEADARVFRPVRYQSPLKRIEGALLRFGIEPDGQDFLTRGDIVTDG